MIKIRDHYTECIFDPWGHLGPKRRKLMEQSWAGLFRKHLFEKIPANRIVDKFNAVFGRPSKELYTAIGANILQQLKDLTDEETISSLAFNEQWHYALDITGESDEEKYFCEKTLRNYRKILIEEGPDQVLFETMTDTLIEKFDVDTSKQRLDSTHICSNMRKLKRLEIFVQTIVKFLKKLNNTYKDVFDEFISPELQERYFGKDSKGCFSKVKPSESSKNLQQAGEDLLYLVDLFSSDTKVKKLHAYRLLKRVLSEQCVVTGSGKEKKLEIRPAKEISSDSLQNPSDTDAGYDGHKGTGYQVQIMESYQPVNDGEKLDKSKPKLITYVDVEPAHKHDSGALQPALDNTKARECLPDEIQCDTLYGSDENVQKAKEKGVSIISPVSGQSESKAKNLKDFTFDESTMFIQSCPMGHKPVNVKRKKFHRISARFSNAHCSACPCLKTCPVVPLKNGEYSVRYNDKHFRLALRRAYEETPEFKDKYRWRAGIEGTQSHYKSDLGARRLRVRGLPQVRFSTVLKALGLNIFRAAAAQKTSFYSFFKLFFNVYNLSVHKWTKIMLVLRFNRPVILNQLSMNNFDYVFI